MLELLPWCPVQIRSNEILHVFFGIEFWWYSKPGMQVGSTHAVNIDFIHAWSAIVLMEQRTIGQPTPAIGLTSNKEKNMLPFSSHIRFLTMWTRNLCYLYMVSILIIINDVKMVWRSTIWSAYRLWPGTTIPDHGGHSSINKNSIHLRTIADAICYSICDIKNTKPSI